MNAEILVNHSLTIIGGGHITEAFLQGLKRVCFPLKSIRVYDKHPEKRNRLKNAFGIQASPEPFKDIPINTILVLTIRPGQIKSFCQSHEFSNSLVISLQEGSGPGFCFKIMETYANAGMALVFLQEQARAQQIGEILL